VILRIQRRRHTLDSFVDFSRILIPDGDSMHAGDSEGKVE
jgi:hypothetical protein